LLGSIVVTALWGSDIYDRLDLSDNGLRVGRGEVAIADIDPRLELRRAEDVFDAETLQWPWPGRRFVRCVEL